jgi:hypothetical protein
VKRSAATRPPNACSLGIDCSLNHRHMLRHVTRGRPVQPRIVPDLDLPAECAKTRVLIERQRVLVIEVQVCTQTRVTGCDHARSSARFISRPAPPPINLAVTPKKASSHWSVCENPVPPVEPGRLDSPQGPCARPIGAKRRTLVISRSDVGHLQVRDHGGGLAGGDIG